MFITKSGKSVDSLRELQEGKDWDEFLIDNVDIWKKTINALGYSFVEQKDSPLPVWLKNPLPEKYKNKKLEMFPSVDEYDYRFDSWICDNMLVEDNEICFDPDYKNWSPNFILDQAQALEKKLLVLGKYKSKDTDYDLGKEGLKGIKYSGSENYKEIYVVGMSEPDIITRAFIEFIDNKENLRRKI